jgi:hypothetical protein
MARVRTPLASLVAVLAIALVAPSAASGQAVTFGSPLAVAPNLNFGCETMPTPIPDASGNYALVGSGVPDCTWRQSGVFAPQPGDPRFSSVPGDGRITRVEVRAGPNPAPLRFVVFSQLGNVGGTENSQCCFFVSETQPVQLQPNAINTFAVDIPVERNTLKGIRRFDLMGISAASGTGTLPLAQVGPVNTFALTTPGSVNAGFWYPRLSPNGQDVGGGRRETGLPGVEVLVRWTWEPAGAAGGGGGGPVTPTPLAPGIALQGANGQIARGNALIPLICNGDAACAGRLQLLAARAGAAGKKKRKAKKPAVYGSARYSVAPGGQASVRVKLNRAAKKKLKGKRGLSVRVKVTPKGGSATTTSMKLKVQGKKRGRPKR